jgi:hypothetical protein
VSVAPSAFTSRSKLTGGAVLFDTARSIKTESAALRAACDRRDASAARSVAYRSIDSTTATRSARAASRLVTSTLAIVSRTRPPACATR